MPTIIHKNKLILSARINGGKNTLRHQGSTKENKKIDISVYLNKNTIDEALEKLASKLEKIYETDDFILNFTQDE